MIWPVGLKEIKEEFGDPTRFIREDGTVRPEWPESILTTLILPAPMFLSWDPSIRVHRIRCHFRVAPSLGTIYARIYDAGKWQAIEEFGGCYCWRPQREGSKLSTHAWAISLDHRVSSCRRGTPGDMPLSVIEIFEAEGWMWGDRFSIPDTMHFQACSGY